MSEQELLKLLALKRCEMPDEDKLARVESHFRHALRIEKIRALSQPPAKTTFLHAILSWSPALACAILLAVTAYQFNTASHTLAESPPDDSKNSVGLQHATRRSNDILFPADFWADAVPAVPTASQLMRNTAFDATPVVFDESRITF